MKCSWYVPSWNGDFRLEPDGETCVLVVHEPTAGEVEQLTKFLTKAKDAGWTDTTEVPTGKRGKVALKATVGEAGKTLVSVITGKRPTSVTAVIYQDGKLDVTETHDASALAETVAKAEAAGDDAKAAATVKRPTPSCPSCQPGAIEPASEVLLMFLDQQQHRDWAKHRVIEVEGHKSGHRYLIAHRHSKHARQWGRIVFDATDDGVLHFYDWTVPPEEEVLAAALILSSREPWLRNEATCLSGPGTQNGPTFRGFTRQYKNPFGGIQDGTEASGFFRPLGVSLAMLAAQADVPELLNTLIPKDMKFDPKLRTSGGGSGVFGISPLDSGEWLSANMATDVAGDWAPVIPTMNGDGEVTNAGEVALDQIMAAALDKKPLVISG